MSLFIVFEGPEGSGKSTQSRLLSQNLERSGIINQIVREPGSTQTGEKVRNWLITGSDMSPLTELFLFSAARSELVESTIRPALKSGEVVICDRYFYSTLAYQGYGRGLSQSIIETTKHVATSGLYPDLVILLDLPSTQGLERIQAGNTEDRFENADLIFHEKVRDGYANIASRDSDRWLVLDASKPPEQISSNICTHVLNLMQNRSQD